MTDASSRMGQNMRHDLKIKQGGSQKSCDRNSECKNLYRQRHRIIIKETTSNVKFLNIGKARSKVMMSENVIKPDELLEPSKIN